MQEEMDKIIEKLEKSMALSPLASLADNKRKVNRAMDIVISLGDTVTGELFKKNLGKLANAKDTSGLFVHHHKLMSLYTDYKRYGVHLDEFNGQNIPSIDKIQVEKTPTERIESLLFSGFNAQITASVCQASIGSVYAVRTRIKDAGYDPMNLNPDHFYSYKRDTIFKK